MFAGMTKGRKLVMFIAFIMVICAAFYLSMAEVLMPKASGTKVQTDGKLTVDSSHSDEGYIMVKGDKNKKKLKLTISINGTTLKYNINSKAEYEVFPLQYGRGNYTVKLYQNVKSNKYKEVGQVTVSSKGMEDELRCFLYPNQYVNYTADTECVKVACDLCKGMTDQKEIYKTVCKYVVSNFSYDFIKSVTVEPGVLPDIDSCWQ